MMKELRSVVLAAMMFVMVALLDSSGYAMVILNEDNGYLHFDESMDRYHKTFDVHTDRDAGGNHFFASGWLGWEADIAFDSAWTQNPYEGTSCIKIVYSPSSSLSWAGVYWQNPENNWGTIPDAGYDLTGATVLTFMARGQLGGEEVEFYAFGVGRNPSTGVPISPYPDSSPKVSLGYVTLSTDWQKYTIDLTGVDLSYVIGGFGWSTNWGHNPSGATFYLDQIQYDLSRLDEPRFLRSYETIQLGDPDFVLTNAAYTYDNALAALAYIARGEVDDLRRARLILDAFVLAQKHDRYYTDGRLRNAYMCGDLLDGDGNVRHPGWWDDADEKWYEDSFQISTHTGNLAWVMIAFLRYYQDIEENDEYLSAAKILGEWIFNHTHDATGIGGYTAGYEGWEPNPTKLTYKSTEHNIDLYSAFMNLHYTTDDPGWLERAQHALHFLEAVWNDVDGHFWIGTTPDGQTIWNDIPEIQPMDTNTWGFMALGSAYRRGIDWVEANCSSTCSGFEGFDYNYDNDRSAVWFEGSAQMVLAYKLLGEEAKAEFYLDEIRRVQVEGPNNNGKGIISACPDGLDTYLGWLFFSRLHVGATSWYLLAEVKYNPLRTGEWPAVYDQIFESMPSEDTLSVLRRYRDEVLMMNPLGRELVSDLYENHSLELATIILTHKKVSQRCAWMVRKYLSEIKIILAGGEIEITGSKLAQIIKFLDDISDFSGTELKEYIGSVKMVLQEEDLSIFGVRVEDKGKSQKPQSSRLLQNQPNPFNPDTWIPYQLRDGADVSIRIYTASGKLVRVLDLGHKLAGSYTTKSRSAYWDGRNEAGEYVASGIYFYILQAGEFTATKKMVMTK